MASLFSNENDSRPSAFEAEALPFLDALYHKAFYLARNPEDASDLVVADETIAPAGLLRLVLEPLRVS